MSGSFRSTCYSCFRPSSHCVCGFIAPFTAHCNFLILQHPHERRKYYSTAKLVLHGVINSRLLRGLAFEPGVLEAALEGQTPYLLYPGNDAQDCETVHLDENSTVIVLDGTWSEAGKILRRNPILSTFPSLTFRRDLRSQYKIRKQPKDFCLSTIECIGHLLNLNYTSTKSLQAPDSYQGLFTGFERMVDRQLSYFPRMKSINSPHKALY